MQIINLFKLIILTRSQQELHSLDWCRLQTARRG